MATNVIDVWRGTGNIDFKKVKAAGVTGVIIKAGVTGWGSAHSMEADANWETNYKKAKEAGLNVGAYYYSGAMSKVFAEKEAKFFLSLLKGKTLELPVYMDVEETHSPTNMPSLGRSGLTDVVYHWCEIVEKAGYFTGFYSSKSWALDYLDMNRLSRFTFWLAHYTSKTTYTGTYGMWQYTSTGKVNGISENVDLNYCYQDFPTMIKNAGLNGFKKEADKRYKIEVYGATAQTMPLAVEALKKAGFTAKVTEI